MQECRNIADSNLAVGDEIGDRLAIGDINLAASASGVVVLGTYFPCIFNDVAGNVNAIFWAF